MNAMGTSSLLACLIMALVGLANAIQFTPLEARCHVCKATVHEMEEAISKVNPQKTADVSGFRLDAAGNTITKTVKLAKSEVYLTELMETICDKMEDYAKATHKKTGKFAVIKMTTPSGQMNPEIPNYDFVQDGDLNKSLSHYCLEILEDQEEAFLKAFMSETVDDNVDIRICSEHGKYCKDGPIQEEYNLEDDEYKDEL